MVRARRSALIAPVVLFAAAPLAARAQHQSPTTPARALTPADYAKWETLGTSALSPDGKWIAYDFRRGNGSSEVVYRALDTQSEHNIRSATGPQFSGNGHWMIYTILPDTAGGGAAGRGGRGARGGAGGPAAAQPMASHNKAGIIDLRSGATTTLDDIQSYTLSNDGTHVVFRRYASPGRHSTDAIVRDLDAGTELTLGNVADLAWNDDGDLLAMVIDVEGRAGNGVQLLDTRTGAIRSLDAGDNHYTGLQWRPRSSDLAALRSRTDSAFADTSYAVIAWRGLPAQSARQTYDFSADNGFPNGMRVAGYRAPQWSDDGATLMFGIAPRDPKPEPAPRAAGELPPARVQIWHWKDLREFHEQEVAGAQDRQRTTPVAWHIGASSVARLSTDPYEVVQYAPVGSVALATDEGPYARDFMSGRPYRDVYRIDIASGKRDKIVTKSLYGASLSPSGRYALYQQDGQWWSVDLTNDSRANLTGKSGVAFANMEDDHPVPERRAYGMAGFVAGEKAVILYDRFDLWRVNLDGSALTRLTKGREDSTVYRCVSEGSGFGGGGGGRGGAAAIRATAPCSLDGEGRTIDTGKPLMLSATGEYSKKSGYAALTIGGPVQRLVWLDKQVTGLKKAKKADVYVMEEQTYEQSPNFFVAGAGLADAKQVSHTNAFQSDHPWGKQELMSYTNKHGDRLQMMLTYPANYEPGKKYPMVVYYYEKLSQGFHQYVVPSERSTYNTTNFSQNGYFVLRPDIVFQARNPGYSGLDCVTAAVSTVLARVPDIDPKHVGNMGHSWGGYQSAFYAVHGHGMFAATIAGAPLTDLISMYGYTSGNSGLPETGHYETSQERMQVPLWEDPQAYIRNSTVFAVDSLQTPLLLEEGDADGNVNHFQSEELYNFGRRLGKNVVYLVYEGENHGVARPESQADYTRRQLEWFGHYLKGEPAQPWITDGESYLARQRILKGAAVPGETPAVQAGSIRPNGAP
jgi:dienelactone hydrolase